MLRCKQVSDALAKKNFRDFTWRERIGALLHIVLCPLCGKFNKDIITMQETTREFSEKEQESESALNTEAKERINKKIRDSLNDTSN